MKRSLVAVYVVLLILGVPVVAGSFSGQQAPGLNLDLQAAEGCVATESKRIVPGLVGANQVWRRAFRCSGFDSEVHVFRFNSQGPGREATAKFDPPFDTRDDQKQSTSFGTPVNEGIVNDERWFTADWYLVDGKVSNSMLSTKFVELVAILQLRRIAVTRVVTMVSVPHSSQLSDAATVDKLNELNESLKRQYDAAIQQQLNNRPDV